MVHPFVSAPNFVSVTSPMGILFPIVRRDEVSTLWSSFFLSFMFCKLYLGYSKFLGAGEMAQLLKARLTTKNIRQLL